jgi:cytosine/adenosine deaminase-related metal-dependent hydrolase
MNYTIQAVLIPIQEGYETVDVHIVDRYITAIAPSLPSQGILVNGKDKLLLPGFVNAHTHTSEMWQRGLIAPLPLELWLSALERGPQLTPDQIYLSSLGMAVETLCSGGTTIMDHLVVVAGQELESIAAAAHAYQEIGIRAFIAPLIQDSPLSASIPTRGRVVQHDAYPMSTSANLDMMQSAIEQFHQPETGISIAVGPTGFQLCSDELFQGCVDLSDRYQLRRHTHLLETKAQKNLAKEKYGHSAVEHLKQLGYLGSRTSLAHCVWLDNAEIEILAETHSTVVHNPLSNLRLGSGIAPILKYRRAGVNVAFGCDGPASNDGQDLLEAIKIGTLLHTITDDDYRHWITPREAVEMASLGGVTGLDLADELGRIDVGKVADLVMYDLKNFSLLPRTDPIGLLVMGRPVHVVDSVWINGKRVVADGEITTVNVSALKQQLYQQSNWQPPKRLWSADALEAQYRWAMGLSE